jgi:flagellar M-ring protein FliF
MATNPDAVIAGSPPHKPPQTVTVRMQDALARLTNQQKVALIVALAMIVALLVGSWLFANQPSYKVLFSNLSERDGGSIIAALDQMNVPYKFSEGGGAILVPGERVHEARLRLATQGLPKGGAVGFELMENQKFGISQFAEQVNYQRALEGELSRTIESVAAVQMVRVHLAIPKPSVFVREEQKPTASVFLHLHPGRHLEPMQIAGITHLVASSIPNLPASNITIVDQSGALLSQLKSSLTEAGLDPTQLKYVREVENDVIKRIEDILQPVTGPGNVRVQAAADVDFSQSEQTAETFKPNGDPRESSIRSQQSSEQAGGSPNPLGVPGALSNQPPVPATAPLTTPAVAGAGAPAASTVANAPGRLANAGINAQIASVGQPLNSRKDTTVNYEVDKTITHIKNQFGKLKRLSVAVVVNNRADKGRDGKPTLRNLSEAELKQLNDLAKQAMGFSPQRGDSLSLVNSPFSVGAEESTVPVWKQPDFYEFVKELVKYLLIAAIIAYLLLAVVRPIVREMLTPRPGERTLAGPDADDEKRVGFEDKPDEELNLALASYEHKLTKARQIANNDPKAVANILKDWMAPNG